jgi:uncharacterized UPF0160 family protein
MSSAGMVFLAYGRQILKRLATEFELSNEEVFEQTYLQFVHEFDATDNGMYNNGKLTFTDMADTTLVGSQVAVYTSAPQVISKFNRADLNYSGPEQDAAFEEARAWVTMAFRAACVSMMRHECIIARVVQNLDREVCFCDDEFACARSTQTALLLREICRKIGRSTPCVVFSRDETVFEARCLTAAAALPVPSDSSHVVFAHKGRFLIKFESLAALRTYIAEDFLNKRPDVLHKVLANLAQFFGK